MNQSPTGSFLKFSVGFLVFISISLGITVAVNSYDAAQNKAHQTAAAIQAMLEEKK